MSVHHLFPQHRLSTAVPTGRLGIWWLLGGEIVIFGGLVVSYLLSRWHHLEWAAEAAHTNEIIGLLNTIILLTSSLAAVLAHQAVHHGNLKQARRLLAATMLLGLSFLIFKGFEYSYEIAGGFTPMKNLFWSYYYMMTGLHALHILVGLIAIFVVWLGLKENKNVQRVEYVGIYWHFVDVVWIFLFPLLYLAG